jgi:hypothetical protein
MPDRPSGVLTHPVDGDLHRLLDGVRLARGDEDAFEQGQASLPVVEIARHTLGDLLGLATGPALAFEAASQTRALLF